MAFFFNQLLACGVIHANVDGVDEGHLFSPLLLVNLFQKIYSKNKIKFLLLGAYLGVALLLNSSDLGVVFGDPTARGTVSLFLV